MERKRQDDQKLVLDPLLHVSAPVQRPVHMHLFASSSSARLHLPPPVSNLISIAVTPLHSELAEPMAAMASSLAALVAVFVALLLMLSGTEAKFLSKASNITVVGSVYCDACSNNTFSKHSFFLKGEWKCYLSHKLHIASSCIALLFPPMIIFVSRKDLALQ